MFVDVLFSIPLLYLAWHDSKLAGDRITCLVTWYCSVRRRVTCYTGSDNEDDDFNDFTMNKGIIQYN